MNETMTPTEAARVLADASRYEDALVQRTEGLTVMVWGFVTPAIFLTYAAFSASPLAPVLWVPWVGAGAVTTYLVWRSAALSTPAPSWERPGWSLFARWLGFVALMTAAFFVFRPQTAAGPLVIVGLMWSAMAGLDLWRTSPRGRVAWAACGGALLVAGAALLALRASDASALGVAVLVTALAPLVAGGHQTLRG